MKIFYLNNPAAYGGRGAKFFQRIKDELSKHNIQFDSDQTEYAGHGTEIVRNINFENYDGVVVSGGDGTVFETLNGYFANKSKKRIPLGVIPIGRGNAFARDLDLHPEKWKEGIDLLAARKTKFVDVGTCRSGETQFYFINILGMGFVTDVAATAQKLSLLGSMSYILGVLYRTIALKPFGLKIEVDGEKLERENVFAEISNTKFTGKDFYMAPSAKFDDGFLNVALLNKLSRIRLLQCLPKIFTGEHVHMKEIETFQAKRLKIETTPQKLLTPDGQLIGSTPIEVECLPRAIEVFTK